MVLSKLITQGVCLFSLFLFVSASKPHAIYVSVTSVYFKADEVLPQIRIRLFFDDLQRCAKEEWNLETRPPLSYFIDDIGMQRYIDDHIKIYFDKKEAQLVVNKLEKDQDDAISVYLNCSLDENEAKTAWNKMRVSNDLFVDYIEEQKNIVRVRYGSDRQFFNLDKDKRAFTYHFN